MEHQNDNEEIAQTPAQDVSPYDAAYPVALLYNGVRKEFQWAQDVMQSIYRSIVKDMPALIQVRQAIDKGCRYVVDMSDETIQAIDNGVLKLAQENGNLYAQLKNNGKYGKKLPIKKEVFRKGIDPAQLANALQMQALQEQLQDMADQLTLIDGSVREVLQGQQNDRIGLYYSGLSLFLESKCAADSSLRSALQAQALRALAEATFQLKLMMESDIRYLEQKEYENAKGKRKQMILEHMNSIYQSFAFIHQATLLRAGIYCDIGELGAMARVLEEYSRFIEIDVAKNALLLAQHDVNDDGTSSGLWATRSELKLDVAEISKALNSPQKTLFLGVAEEETDA